MDFYDVFHIEPKGKIKLIVKPKGRPNGIALSPSGARLFVAITDERNVRAYDMDKESGGVEFPEGARGCAFGDADFKTLYITGRAEDPLSYEIGNAKSNSVLKGV